MKKYSVKPYIWEKEAKELTPFNPVLAHLLFHRGIKTYSEAEEFLNPDYDFHLHDPFLLKDMEKAVERIIKAMDGGEQVAVYSDYDADGVPGAATLHEFFRKAGYLNNVHFYIPHREDEGFGFHSHAVDELKKKNVNLLITIDCGMVDTDAVNRANELGIDVIITDHHLPQDGREPKAYAIVNPQRVDCTYPFKKLCGSGVIFKVIQALISRKDFGFKKGHEKWMLDLVGLATLSDMVPLLGENRAITHYGLKVMKKTQKKGLQKLFEIIGVDRRYLNEDDITFSISPRINAASRMGSADRAFDLLISDTTEKADLLARSLESINNERKGGTASITKQAKKAIEMQRISHQDRKFILMGNPEWKPSLLGPVANGLVEEYNIPVFLWGRANGIMKGSCRAPEGYHIIEIMQKVPEGIFIEFGGHAGSGGFSIREDQIFALENEFSKIMDTIEKKDMGEDIVADYELNIDDVNETLYKEIEKMAPFGMDNPKPVFLLRNLLIDNVKDFGKTKNHLEITFKKNNGGRVKAIGFFMGGEERQKVLKVGERLDLIANLEKSFFRSLGELRLRIVDIN